MFIILWCLENFSIDWRTVTVWDVPEIRYGFMKIFWKVYYNITKEFVEGFSNSFIIWNDILIFNKCDSLFRSEFVAKKECNVFPKIFVISCEFYINISKIKPFRCPNVSSVLYSVLPEIWGYQIILKFDYLTFCVLKKIKLKKYISKPY